jgi:histidine triad (HIT) family protein
LLVGLNCNQPEVLLIGGLSSWLYGSGQTARGWEGGISTPAGLPRRGPRLAPAGWLIFKLRLIEAKWSTFRLKETKVAKLKLILLMLVTLVMGVILGGYLFADTRPRSFLAVNKCEGTCFEANELLGLLTSVGIQRFLALLPAVVKETDKTIVIEHPSPQARIHYLVIPKRDIKNIGELSDGDNEYLVDAFKLVREIVKEKNLTNYRLVTNGPGYQGLTYLHFHLTAN